MLGEAVAGGAARRRLAAGASAARRPREIVRALRLGAAGLAREGRADCALALLDEADRLGRTLGVVRDGSRRRSCGRRSIALAGRLRRGGPRCTSALRPAALASGDDRLAARFLAQEARGLLDRREYRRAIVRLEEALAAAADDPAERAALCDRSRARRSTTPASRSGSEAALDAAHGRARRPPDGRTSRGSRAATGSSS